MKKKYTNMKKNVLFELLKKKEKRWMLIRADGKQYLTFDYYVDFDDVEYIDEKKAREFFRKHKEKVCAWVEENYKRESRVKRKLLCNVILAWEYRYMTTTDYGKMVGRNHPAVLYWRRLPERSFFYEQVLENWKKSKI